VSHDVIAALRAHLVARADAETCPFWMTQRYVAGDNEPCTRCRRCIRPAPAAAIVRNDPTSWGRDL
jgi:ferredoxin